MYSGASVIPTCRGAQNLLQLWQVCFIGVCYEGSVNGGSKRIACVYVKLYFYEFPLCTSHCLCISWECSNLAIFNAIFIRKHVMWSRLLWLWILSCFLRTSLYMTYIYVGCWKQSNSLVKTQSNWNLSPLSRAYVINCNFANCTHIGVISLLNETWKYYLWKMFISLWNVSDHFAQISVIMEKCRHYANSDKYAFTHAVMCFC